MQLINLSIMVMQARLGTRALLLGTALLGWGCDNTVVTPNGTKVVDFSADGKLSVSSWTVNTKTADLASTRHKFRYQRGDHPPMTLEIVVTHGDVPFVPGERGENAPATIKAPVKIEIVIAENHDWAVTGKCEDQLAVPLAVNDDGTSAFPKMVWARCRVVMKRKNGAITVGPSLQIMGDGKIAPDGADAALKEV